MKKIAIIFILISFLTTPRIDAQGIDSLNINSTFITLGQTWYTDYFTSYAVYTDRSFFKDENGGLHVVFLANYELYYCYSEDGLVWSTEQISNSHNGDFREAVIYADTDGNPYIAVTVNPYYDYGNPTGVEYGNEFRYNVYYYFLENGIWVEEEVYNSTLDPGFSGNFGCRVNELYQNMEGEMVLIGHRYGWYTYGGEIWEFTRDTEGDWSGVSIIHGYNDTPVDHSTESSKSVLKSNGERDLIYSRPYNPNGIAELVYMNYSEGAWTEPIVLTTDLINYRSWDLSVSADEDMYMIHYNNTPSPHINMYTDFEVSTELPIDLSMVDEIQHAKIHITGDGFLDLLVYPVNPVDTAILYVSEDGGYSWSDAIYVERSEFPGVLPVTDQFSDQSVDLEFIRVSRVSGVEPYGPDSLFYNHVEHINSTLGITDYEMSSDRLSFYPNPISDMVTLNYLLKEPTLLTIRVFNLEGKILMERNFPGGIGENQIRMNLDELDSGTYLMEVLELNQVRDISRKATGKFVKL